MRNIVFIILLVLGIGMITAAVLVPRLSLMSSSSGEISTNSYEVRLLIFVEQYDLVYNIQKISSKGCSASGLSFEWDRYPSENTAEPLYSLYQKTKIIIHVDHVRSDSNIYTISHSSWTVGVNVKGLSPGKHQVEAYLYVMNDLGQWVQKSSYTTTIQVP
ncbi:MAG: hypothetical protein J7L82_02330 [Staphylothermus sp.]|nr:hypothetical protein [Staphylothermus sp.]